MHETWPLARDGDQVRMRNVLYEPGPLPEIVPRQDFEEQAFVEWRFSLGDVEAFLRKHGV